MCYSILRTLGSKLFWVCDEFKIEYSILEAQFFYWGCFISAFIFQIFIKKCNKLLYLNARSSVACLLTNFSVDNFGMYDKLDDADNGTATQSAVEPTSDAATPT